MLLARRITQPLRVMSESVKDFAQGRFKTPLPDSSGDEIGLLAREFNAMAQAISAKETELRRLEQRFAVFEAKVRDLAAGR